MLHPPGQSDRQAHPIMDRVLCCTEAWIGPGRSLSTATRDQSSFSLNSERELLASCDAAITLLTNWGLGILR